MIKYGGFAVQTISCKITKFISSLNSIKGLGKKIIGRFSVRQAKWGKFFKLIYGLKDGLLILFKVILSIVSQSHSIEILSEIYTGWIFLDSRMVNSHYMLKQRVIKPLVLVASTKNGKGEMMIVIKNLHMSSNHYVFECIFQTTIWWLI